MRINTNISAMNTYGRLTNANASKSNSLAKLSSGLRINKAGDDAAGLAISEKMKSQIGGLKQATRNAQDGISLIQTAEGALNETHAILGRMRDLAVQGSNGTLSEDDRGEINKEFDALKTEITRISTDTEFNTKKLLNTADQEFTFQIGANGGQTMKVKIGNMNASELGLDASVSLSAPENADVSEDARVVTAQQAVTNYTAPPELTSRLTTAQNGANAQTAAANIDPDNDGDAHGLDDTTGAVYVTAGIDLSTVTTNADLKAAVAKLDADVAGAQEALDADRKDVDDALASATTAALDTLGRTNASDAIESIDAAIKEVSAQRSSLGAAQNRLSHTVKNLTTTQENLSEANSRIRDVDMAEEMMEFTKNNILSQAATSMLSQANAMPNSVLGLLQG